MQAAVELSDIQISGYPDIPDFRISGNPDFRESGNPHFLPSGFREFQISGFLNIWNSEYYGFPDIFRWLQHLSSQSQIGSLQRVRLQGPNTCDSFERIQLNGSNPWFLQASERVWTAATDSISAEGERLQS